MDVNPSPDPLLTSTCGGDKLEKSPCPSKDISQLLLILSILFKWFFFNSICKVQVPQTMFFHIYFFPQMIPLTWSNSLTSTILAIVYYLSSSYYVILEILELLDKKS